MAKISANYEVVYIIDPAQSEEAIAATVAKFQTLAEQNGSDVVVDEWGKRRLAYAIDYKTEGYYVLMSFTSGPEFPKELDRILGITEGIMRSVYFDGVKERTLAFALPGTMSMSLHSYYMNRPVFLQHEACCEAAVLCSTKQNFDRFISLYPEFAQWALNMAYCQLYFYEMKLCVIKGDARERFRALIQNRPEILEKVPLNAIASYLGITPSYLSRLKKKLRHK